MSAQKRPAPDAVDERTAAQIIADAEREIVEAERREAALVAAVETGDDSVTFEHVEAARKQSAWARMRRKGEEARAARAAELGRERQYDALVARLLPRITVDHSEREAELLGVARGALEELVELYVDRNLAVATLGIYLGDPANFRRPDDDLEGEGTAVSVPLAKVTYQGRRYAYQPPSDVLQALVDSLRNRVANLSQGIAPDRY